MMRALMVAAALAAAAGTATADNILVLDDTGHGCIQTGIANLQSLGHTITTSNVPLGNYSGYDQVWDLRYNTALGAQDITDMGAYLQGGGRMYLSGENSGFEGSRNISLRNWITAVGGGTVGNYVQGCAFGTEGFTTFGQTYLNNNPNPLGGISYQCGETYTQAGLSQGSLVTVGGGGDGGLIGWNFGDITNAPNARMLVGFDIEVFCSNGADAMDNFATFLGNGVPAPGTAGLFGLAGFAAGRRRRA